MLDNLGVKVVCLLVAALLWVQVASTVEVEQIVRLPVEVSGLADSLAVAASALPDEVSVRIRGSRLQLLLSDVVQRDLGRVDLDLTGLGPGIHRYDVTVLDVRVNASPLEVVPAISLQLDLQALVRRQVPVRLELEGDIPEGFTLAGRPELTPERVELVGPADVVSRVDVVRTETVRLGKRRSSFQQRVALVDPGEDLRVRPIEVEVAIGIDAVVERSFDDVPVTVLSSLAPEWIAVEPTTARVRVVGAAAALGRLRPEEISVLVPIDADVRGVAQVPAQVAVPDGVLSFTVQPPTFQVIVDERRGAETAAGGRR